MASRNPQSNWILPTPPCLTEFGPQAQGLLEQLRECCTQVRLAADFLLLEVDEGPPSPRIQLACLIKERAGKIQEQLETLCQVLNCPASPCESPSH